MSEHHEEEHHTIVSADGKHKIEPADKVGGQRQPNRPLSHHLSDALQAKLPNDPETEQERAIAFALAQAEKQVIKEENLVAATAKDLFGEQSKAVASTYHPPQPHHDRHDHGGASQSQTINQPAARSMS